MRIIGPNRQENIVKCDRCGVELSYDDSDCVRTTDTFGIEYEDYITCISCGNTIIVGGGYIED